jgi:Leucine-rich repeat (LRR) protein
VTITCAGAELGDSKIAEILLNVPPKTPLDTLILSGNKLTKVPSTSSRRSGSGSEDDGMIRATTTKSLLTKLTQLNNVDLSSNVITTIGAGELTLTASLKFLSLANNTIASIEADALPSTSHF